MSMDDPYECIDAMQREIDLLKKQNEQLRSRLEPERQKIWVLVWRLESGRVISESHTDPDEFYARETEIRSKGLKHVSILTSLPI